MKELGRFCATAGLAMLVLAACAADPTPLHKAAVSGDVEAARALLADGAEVNARAKGKVTPLHLAAIFGNTATVRALIEGGAIANARDENKLTPLHGAAQAGNAATVRSLIEGGAIVNARDENKLTPLHYATAAGIYLALKGVDVEKAEVRELMTRIEETFGSNSLNTFDLSEMTAMANLIGTVHRAATIRALLAGGADVNARAEGKFAPLHFAAMYGDSVAGRALIEGGADVHAHAEGKLTPLHVAALLGNAGAIEVLLEAGGNPNAVASGCGPMDIARLRMKATERSIAPFREAVERLLAAGAQPRNGCKKLP